MKKIISMILIVVMMLACLCVLTGCGDKNKDEENANVVASAPQYKWPNLTSYGISNFTAGTIKSLDEVKNENEYVFKYEIVVDSVSKEDINNYCDSFSDWLVTESEGKFYIVKIENSTSYTIVISLDETNNSAKLVISAIK